MRPSDHLWPMKCEQKKKNVSNVHDEEKEMPLRFPCSGLCGVNAATTEASWLSELAHKDQMPGL